jgi:hypothetical protein
MLYTHTHTHTHTHHTQYENVENVLLYMEETEIELKSP